MATLKQTKTITGSTNSSSWTWKQIIYEYWDDDYIAKNRSRVVVDTYFGRASGAGNSYFGGSTTSTITCNGTTRNSSKTYSYPTNISAGEWVFVQSETFYIEHASDGTKTVSVSSTLSTDFTPGSGSASGSVTLTTIPRASEVSCSSPYIGDNAIISVDKKSSSFTSNLTYKIGTLTGTIATKTSETTVQFKTSEIEEETYALIPNAKEAQGTIYCETYSGNTKIGDTKSTIFNLYAKESVCKPDVSATIVDINESVTDVMGSNTKFVKYISKPKVTISATPKMSASIKSYSINLNDGQASNLQEDTFDTIGSNKVSVSVTDSRGYSNSEGYTLDMVDYIKLHINTISITRPEGTSNEAILNVDGAYYNGSFTDDISNSLVGSFKYRLSDTTEWTEGGTLTPVITDNTFKITDFTLGNNFDYEEEYQFMITFEDTFVIASRTVPLEKGQEVIAVGDNEVFIYKNLYVNDYPVLYFTEEEEW